MRDGLNAKAAAQAVGVPRVTLYLWAKAPEPRSRRPHRLRQARRPPGLVVAIEKMRRDNPLAGKHVLGKLLRKAGWDVADSMVGRIIGELIPKGRVQSINDFKRKCPARPKVKKRPHAIRKPKDIVFAKPGDVAQIDTMTITQPIASRSNTSTPTIHSPNGPSPVNRCQTLPPRHRQKRRGVPR
jgi:hypothetical protein